MDSNTTNPLSQSEAQRVREALSLAYPNARNVLGAQLGGFIRDLLDDPDLKRRFGGLRSFAEEYFPTEILWRGKKGLDDLYDISLGDSGRLDTIADWQPVPPDATPLLWAAVTNPNRAVQFAWSPENNRLMRAPTGVQRPEGLNEVAKLSVDDYHAIAKEFVGTLQGDSAAKYIEALHRSATTNTEFTALLRQDGLLAQWEAFRVEHAIQYFGNRLENAGAGAEAAAAWKNLLRSAQGLARSQRSQTANLQPATTSAQKTTARETQRSLNRVPDTKEVATRALNSLSPSDIADLRLPLGAVMQAIRDLMS